MEKQHQEEEISLKDLIMMLVNNWKIIVAITLIGTILGGIYVFATASTSYESRIEGTINIPEYVQTKFGEYTLPTEAARDYLSIIESDKILRQTVERLDLDTSVTDLRRSITIVHHDNSNNYSFSLTAETPELANNLMETLAEEYIEEVNLINKKLAIDYFIRKLSVEAESFDELEIRLTDELHNAEAILETIEPTIKLRRLILDNPLYLEKLAVERDINISELSDESMLEEVINPNYQLQESEIIDLRDQLGKIDIERSQNARLSEELMEENEYYLAYRKGEENQMRDGLLEVLRPSIRINGEAMVSENPTGSNKKLIFGVFTVLGVLIGVFAAYFKAYWERA